MVNTNPAVLAAIGQNFTKRSNANILQPKCPSYSTFDFNEAEKRLAVLKGGDLDGHQRELLFEIKNEALWG